MGLAITVGLFEADEDDPDAAAWDRKQLREINRVLKANGLPKYEAPTERPKLGPVYGLSSHPYSWLHYLRRAVAHSRKDPKKFKPVKKGEDPSKDPLIDDELSIRMDSHVICHSDSEGFYVPIEFDEPLFDDKDRLTGAMLGSSPRALAELVQAAPLIGIPLKDGVLSAVDAKRIAKEDYSRRYGIERQVWLTFYEELVRSVQHGLVVVFR